MFRYQENQKTSNRDAYFDEARIVIKRYQRPVMIPATLLRRISFLFKAFDPSKDWMGISTHCVYLDTLKNQWIEIVS
jgi:hypothetical protein